MSLASSDGDPFVDTSELHKPPFDTARLDRLMEEAELDALLVTAKHSIQYLLGGYRFFFYENMDAHGISRYLPFFVYVKGRPDDAAYVGVPLERSERELGRFWVSNFDFTSYVSVEYAAAAAAQLKRVGRARGRVGIEVGFMPVDAYRVLGERLPDVDLVDATYTLEMLRALKTPRELELLRLASDKVVDAMLEVMAAHGPGTTKRELVEALRIAETTRGMNFDYALTNVGTVFNRAPSDQVWREGETLALDSGGNYKGYIGDLTRMAYLGTPDGELVDLLGQVEDVQQTARRGLRAGVRGGDIFDRAGEALARSSAREQMSFSAHGMGIVAHEPPWLMSTAFPHYPARHADLPLEAGMVISIETDLRHTRRGFIKLEDTVAITADGWEAYGDHGRGWNAGGSAARREASVGSP